MTFVLRHDALSWGRAVRTPQRVASPRFRDQLTDLIAARPGGTVLPVGMLRSYGDSALNSRGGVVVMTGLDRFIEFDVKTGMLRAEAGATLGAIMKHAVPFGFFFPVTPGTRFVTIGGAIANDVHGKNHPAAGTFGRYVRRLGLLRGDGSRIEIRPDRSGDLFSATVGGLGLTGIIEWAEIALQPIKSSQLDVEIIAYEDLAEFWHLAETARSTHEHAVAWFDCAAPSGRGIFSRANWNNEAGYVVRDDRQRFRVPIDAPPGILNGLTVRLFNSLYYTVQKHKAGIRRQHYLHYFYPLDGVAEWNRLYGRHGFWQYQCVVPPETMKDAIAALLAEIIKSRQGSFLAVLKVCGRLASPGLMSFPMEGATLALDFPNRGERTTRLLSSLDAIVCEAKGRLYAAKDGRIPKPVWAAGYPNLERFMTHVDPVFSSDFWRRVAP